MQIAVLCHEFPPVGGGAAAVGESLAQAYRANGHGVTVVTMGFEDLPREEIQNGVRVIRVPCGRKRRDMASPVEGLRWAWNAWPLLKRLHAQSMFHVCHAHFIMPAGILASWMKREFGVPFLITPHGSDVPGYNRERLKFAHRVAAPWWRRVCAEADRIVCPSHSLQNMVRSATRACDATVIPNGIAALRFRPLEKQKRILLCSRLVERKGFHLFLEAIAPLNLPGWELDLVGEGPMFARLARQAGSCRIPVHMHGWLDNRDARLAELYGRALIFGLPSEQENFSIALLEGMSAGCAVITTDVSGNPEVIGNTGVLVPPRNVAAIRSAVQELAAHEDRAQRMGNSAARRVASEFTWSNVASRYIAQLQALAGVQEESACASA
ncbi:MAG: glycosyltransferase family 4 protein [Planctomycetaceae bacterium]